MSKAASPQRWYAPWRRAAATPLEYDPADLGTCFGLELSMSTAQPDASRGAPARPGWVHRLAARRRVSA
jgi:hypothetical protein